MDKLISGVRMKLSGGYALATIVLAAGISAAVLMPANRSIIFAQTNSGAAKKAKWSADATWWKKSRSARSATRRATGAVN